MSVRNKAIAVTAVAVAAVAGWEYLQNVDPFDFYAREHDNIGVEQQELRRYDPNLTTNLGSLVASHNIKLDAHYTVGWHWLATPWDFRATKTDPYHAQIVTDSNFTLRGAAEAVMTSRKSLKEPPLPDDTITAQVDRSALFINRPRDVFLPSKADTSYKVKDGFITERGGEPVADRERIFAKDGTYTVPKSHLRGGPSKVSRAINAFTFDNVRVGEDSYDHMLQAGQVEAQDPKCVEAAWKVVSPDEAATAAITDELVLQGYRRNKITVAFEGAWPKPDKLKDEEGKTYKQRQHDLQKSVPGDQKIQSTNQCKTGNVKNTLKSNGGHENVAAGRVPAATKR